MTFLRPTLSRALLLLGASLAAPSAWAQATAQGVPNAMQGFSTNRDQPIQIEATSLEVRNNESVATFTGNVHVIQGDTHLHTKALKVFYEQGEKQGAPQKGPRRPARAATPGPAGQQQIRRLEALDSVVVIQKDQTASGDKGIFDTGTNSVTLQGNVVVSQGTNTLMGERLVVNLQTGVSRMEGGRVTGSFSTGGAGASMPLSTLGGAKPPPAKTSEGRPSQPGTVR